MLAGFAVFPACTPSFKKQGTTYHKLRQMLESTEVIEGGALSQDYEFSAPSAASPVILGDSSNGNVSCKTEDGKLLNELQRYRMPSSTQSWKQGQETNAHAQ